MFSFPILATVSFTADLTVRVKPVILQQNHEIEFECVMSNVKLGAPASDVVYDVEWYVTKSGRDKLVYKKKVETGRIVVDQSILIPDFKGLNIDVNSQFSF